MPTRTSKTPRRRSRRIATRSSVSTSLWRYWTLTPSSLQVVGQVLGHLLGEGRDQRALAALDPHADLLEQVVDLALGRPDRDRRVDDAGRADELLDDLLAAALQLVRPGRRAHVDGLVDGRLELLERQRPVVERGRQPEPEVDEDLLARPVVLVHADDLRDRHVRLVDDEQPVRREVVEQRPRPRARPRAARGGASSSRRRSSSRARAASRGRTSCAGAAGRPRGPGPRPRARRPAPPSRPRCRRWPP